MFSLSCTIKPDDSSISQVGDPPLAERDVATARSLSSSSADATGLAGFLPRRPRPLPAASFGAGAAAVRTATLYAAVAALALNAGASQQAQAVSAGCRHVGTGPQKAQLPDSKKIENRSLPCIHRCLQQQ